MRGRGRGRGSGSRSGSRSEPGRGRRYTRVPMDLSRATVFVTGATAGFGEACAERFARDGARLVVCGRRADRLEALAKRLSVPVHPVTLDVRDRRAAEAAVAALPRDFAAVDVLVNN